MPSSFDPESLSRQADVSPLMEAPRSAAKPGGASPEVPDVFAAGSRDWVIPGVEHGPENLKEPGPAQAICYCVFESLAYETLLRHCARKFSREFHDGESPEQKAYGLLGGRSSEDGIEILSAVPLRKNYRRDARFAALMDESVARFATSSNKLLDPPARGWVADPFEIFAAESLFDRLGVHLVGSYHMHTVMGDRCTKLDRDLATGTELWTVIVSMSTPRTPSVRAFYEGDNHREATLIV